MPNYDINYEDERFKQVESQKQEQLNNINNTYNNMVNQSDQFYQKQLDAVNNYADIQKQNQQANTDFAIEQINQQKEQAKKDYTKEQTGAYVDWQKQSNKYGANAEQMAAQGMQNTGYSESSQISMYNTYQNRVASAKESYDKAVQNYNNSITQAILANNSALAEIANNALQKQLELSLQGFQYKNDLLQTQINLQRDIDNTYYNRWRDVLNQFNTENALKEDVRQYNENMAENKRQYDERMAEERRQYDETMAENRRQYEEQLAYKKEQDRLNMEYQKERDRVSDDQWQKQYNLSLASTYSKSSGGSSGSGSSGSKSGYATGVLEYGTLVDSYGDGNGNMIYTDSYGNTYKMKDGYNPYTGTKNNDVKNGTFSNGYQPNNVNGYELHKTGKTGTINGQEQNIWKTGSVGSERYYYWDGTQNKYISLNSAEKKAFGLS